MSRQEAYTDLQAKVGAESRLSHWFTMTQEMISGFADATLDRQWIHVDVERATRESLFGAPVAHGFFTLSLIPHLTGMVEQDSPLYPDVTLTVSYGLNRVRFPPSSARRFPHPRAHATAIGRGSEGKRPATGQHSHR